MTLNIFEIFELINKIESSITLEDTLLQISNAAQKLFEADSITILDVRTRPYHLALLKNIDAQSAANIENFLNNFGEPYNIEEVKKTKEPLLLSDTFSYDFWIKSLNAPRSWIGIPIIVDKEVCYVVNVDKNIPGYFTEEHLKLTKPFSIYISSVLNKTLMFEKLFNISNVDPLTSVKNRLTLFEELERKIEKYKRFKTKFTCLMLDIDKFKEVNDAFGHDIGDEALVKFAKALKKAIRDSDSIFRYGGDEFFIILENADNNDAICVASRILEYISKIKVEQNLYLSTSIGIKEYSGENINDFVKELDRAMYKAKKTGKKIMID